jgi:hypothetical protein
MEERNWRSLADHEVLDWLQQPSYPTIGEISVFSWGNTGEFNGNRGRFLNISTVYVPEG